jgi:hypothetical protein
VRARRLSVPGGGRRSAAGQANLRSQNSYAVVTGRATWVVAARRAKQPPTHLARHAHVVDTENASDGEMKLVFDLAPRSSRQPAELSDVDRQVAVESVVLLHKISLGAAAVAAMAGARGLRRHPGPDTFRSISSAHGTRRRAGRAADRRSPTSVRCRRVLHDGADHGDVRR